MKASVVAALFAGRVQRTRLCLLVVLGFTVPASVALALPEPGGVPLAPQPGQAVRLGAVETSQGLTVATRPSDGVSLAVYSPFAGEDKFAPDDAQPFAAGGRPLGGPVALSTLQTPPAWLSGYTYGGYTPSNIAYSPSTDEWLVFLDEEFQKHCSPSSSQWCYGLVGVLDRLDSHGLAVGAPTFIYSGNNYFFAPTVACRTDGCVLVGVKCHPASPASGSPTPYVCPMVSIPLDANGTPLSSAPKPISSGGHCGRGDTFRQPVIAPTASGYLVSWADTEGDVFGQCVMVRSLSAAGEPTSPERAASRQGANSRVGDPQVCAFNGGHRVLVSWSAWTTASEPTTQDLNVVGAYRQLFTDAARPTGPDTHRTRSVPGEVAGGESMSLDASSNQCVLIRPAFNDVQAFAYGATGRLRQQARLLTYHHRLEGNFGPDDIAEAAWPGKEGLLLDAHFTSQQGPATLSVLPLR